MSNYNKDFSGLNTLSDNLFDGNATEKLLLSTSPLTNVVEHNLSRDNINEIAEFENVMGINGWLNLFKPKEKSKDDEIIMEIIDKRNLARKEKNWKLADELRDKAESLGFILVDKKDSTTWEPKDQ